MSAAPSRRVFAALALSLAAALAALALVPAWDLAVARWAYRGPDAVWALALKAALPWSVGAALVLTAVAWICGWIDRRGAVGILLLYAVGPGLIVNLGLKDHWGRPRPIQSVALGGAQPFFPWFLPGGPCGRNCAFPSGDVAAAAALAGPALVAARRRRWAATGAATALLLGAVGAVTALVAAGRMALGAHHLSDCLAAALIVWTLTRILYPYFVEKAERHG